MHNRLCLGLPLTMHQGLSVPQPRDAVQGESIWTKGT